MVVVLYVKNLMFGANSSIPHNYTVERHLDGTHSFLPQSCELNKTLEKRDGRVACRTEEANDYIDVTFYLHLLK